MANRSVSVELTLKAQQYKTEAEQAAAKTEALKESAKGADKEVDRLGKDSVKAAAELKVLGIAAGDGKVKFDELGKGTDNSLKFIDQRITETRANLKAFAADFNQTGSVNSFSLFKQAAKDLGDLEKLRKSLADAVPSPGGGGSSSGWFKNLFSGANWAGMQAGDAFNGGFLSSLGNIAAAAAPVLIPAAALLVSELLSAAGGALLVGGGLSAIMAAAVIQMKSSPTLAAAGSDFWGWFKSQMVAATQDFWGPIAQSFTILKTELAGPFGDLRGTFAKLAPYTQMFATYLGEAVQKFMPGFLRFLQASGPVLGMFSRELPTIANGLNIMFDEMGKGAKGEGEALNVLIKAISLALAGLGFVVRAAASVWDFFVQKTELAVGVLTKLAGWVPGLGDLLKSVYGYVDGVSTSMDGAKTSADGFGVSIGDLGGPLGQTATQAQLAATAFQNLSKGMDAAFGRTMGVEQATDAYNLDLVKLASSIDKAGSSLDATTEAGAKNRVAIAGLISDINTLRDANIANGMSLDEANGKYEDQLNNLQATLIKMGLNKDAVKALIDQYRGLPSQVSTTVNVLGLDASIYKLDSVSQKLNDLNGKITTTYLVTDLQTGQTQKIVHQQGYNRMGGIYEHAEAGLLSAGIYSAQSPARYAFAEPATGGEAFVPRFGDYGRSTAILDQAARWYGGRFAAGGQGGGAVRVEMAFTGAAAGSLGSVIMGMVRTGEIQIRTSQLVAG